jgi:hypothetical protein
MGSRCLCRRVWTLDAASTRPRSSENRHRYVAHYTWLFLQAYTALLLLGSPQLWFWVASLSLCPMAPRRLLAPPAARYYLSSACRRRQPPSSLRFSSTVQQIYPGYLPCCVHFRAGRGATVATAPPASLALALALSCNMQPATCNLQPAICSLQPHTSKTSTPCLSSTVAQTDI